MMRPNCLVRFALPLLLLSAGAEASPEVNIDSTLTQHCHDLIRAAVRAQYPESGEVQVSSLGTLFRGLKKVLTADQLRQTAAHVDRALRMSALRPNGFEAEVAQHFSLMRGRPDVLLACVFTDCQPDPGALPPPILKTEELPQLLALPITRQQNLPYTILHQISHSADIELRDEWRLARVPDRLQHFINDEAAFAVFSESRAFAFEQYAHDVNARFDHADARVKNLRRLAFHTLQRSAKSRSFMRRYGIGEGNLFEFGQLIAHQMNFTLTQWDILRAIKPPARKRPLLKDPDWRAWHAFEASRVKRVLGVPLPTFKRGGDVEQRHLEWRLGRAQPKDLASLHEVYRNYFVELEQFQKFLRLSMSKFAKRETKKGLSAAERDTWREHADLFYLNRWRARSVTDELAGRDRELRTGAAGEEDIRQETLAALRKLKEFPTLAKSLRERLRLQQRFLFDQAP